MTKREDLDVLVPVIFPRVFQHPMMIIIYNGEKRFIRLITDVEAATVEMAHSDAPYPNTELFRLSQDVVDYLEDANIQLITSVGYDTNSADIAFTDGYMNRTLALDAEFKDQEIYLSLGGLGIRR